MFVCCSPEPLRQVHRERCSSWRFLSGSAPPRSWEGPPHSVWGSAASTPHELRCCWKVAGVKVHVFLNKLVNSKKYPVIDGANLVCPAQLAILLAIFCAQLIWYLKEAFRDTCQDWTKRNTWAGRVYNVVPLWCIQTELTILSSATSDWRRGAAQMSVETASCKPGSSSLFEQTGRVSLLRKQWHRVPK